MDIIKFIFAGFEAQRRTKKYRMNIGFKIVGEYLIMIEIGEPNVPNKL